MKIRIGIALLLVIFYQSVGFTQVDFLTLADADSAYIRKPSWPNDFRLFYGGQGNNISLGTTRQSGPGFSGNIYANTNDYVGFGMTYKWLDGDLSFSLPGTTYLKEERSNLTQFKLALSVTLRKIVFRGYYMDSKGVVVSGEENEFQSTPSLHERRSGIQATYLFNYSRYSYKAAMYQSEYQMKSAGSFMLRIEPFFRNLGGQGGSMIPAVFDTPERYGDQSGLEYIKAPGILFMPGYGVNFAIPGTRLFISPVIFAGMGAAFNSYQANTGKNRYTNMEYAANFNLNMGYNGIRFYSKIQFIYSAGYSPLNPSYFTSSNLTASIWVGVRFTDIEKFIPRSF